MTGTGERLRRAYARARAARGMGLVELMVAVSILSVAILGLVGSFRYITKAIHVARGRTLATNLTQEKIENLKDVSYHKLLLSTVTTTDNNFDPAITYDTLNYPKETITIGGMTFQRAVHVAFAEVTNNEISTVTFNYPDPGLKRVRVYTMWQEGGTWKKLTIDNLYENPDIEPLNTTVTGTVSDGAAGIASAYVQVIENPDWNGIANSAGVYSFSVHAGTYTVRSSSTGYNDSTQTNIACSTGTTNTVNFTLTKIATGTITGNIWLNTGLVISQVVVASSTVDGEGTARAVEYVELYNPTTAALTLYDGSVKTLQLEYWGETGIGVNKDDNDFALVYGTRSIPSNGYFLIASTRTFYILGTLRYADAWYGGGNASLIKDADAGCIRIKYRNTGNILDEAGWCDATIQANANGCQAPNDSCGEGVLIPLHATDGIAEGDQVVRISSPNLVSTTYGPAYDSGENRYDFIAATTAWNGDIIYAPRTGLSATAAPITGKVPTGTRISADDLLGPTTGGYQLTITGGLNSNLSLPYHHFELEGVAVGTWTALVMDEGNYFNSISTVLVTAAGKTGIPNATTVPAWTVSGHNMVNLSSNTTDGFVVADVKDINGNGIGGIQVLVGGTIKTTASNGHVLAQVSSGPITVTANPLNANASYTESIRQITVYTGIYTETEFTLVQGGIIKGFVTTDGSSVLPNISVAALRSGASYGEGTSDSSGYFYIRNVATGTYTVQPTLEPAEVSSPSSKSATVSSTGTIFIGTFTITGALGVLTGSITVNGTLLNSGGLILASTKTISSTPSAIYASSSAAQVFVYAASSLADGTYEINLRGGVGSYNVAAYIPTAGASTVSVSTKSYSGVAVTAGQTTTLNITVP